MANELKISELHKPVLHGEVLEAFGLNKGAHSNKIIIDATLGLGGHTEAFVKSGAKVYALDADLEMLKLAEKRLELACPPSNDNWRSYKLINANFRDLTIVAKIENFSEVDGILFDLGVSSPQITSQDRGISFGNKDAILDMRIDRDGTAVKGSDLLNVLREDQLIDLFREILDYKVAVRLSHNIVAERSKKLIETVGDFVKVIEKSIGKKPGLNISTLPFLALRIAVNSELNNIKESLPKTLDLIKTGGRLAVISFHSGEDKLVKGLFGKFEKAGKGTEITRKPIIPGEAEMRSNPRSRSAKLRILQVI